MRKIFTRNSRWTVQTLAAAGWGCHRLVCVLVPLCACMWTWYQHPTSILHPDPLRWSLKVHVETQHQVWTDFLIVIAHSESCSLRICFHSSWNIKLTWKCLCLTLTLPVHLCLYYNLYANASLLKTWLHLTLSGLIGLFISLSLQALLNINFTDCCYSKRAMDKFLLLHGGCQSIDRVPCHTLQLRGHLI